jgi:Cache domain
MSSAARLLAGVTRRMDEVLGSVAGLAAAAESIAGRAPASQTPASQTLASQSLRRGDFAALRPLVAALLQDHAGLAAGAGVVLAPQMLADTPRCIEWWWADRTGRVVPLDVDTDPESAEFYDYTTTEWYREPERTGTATLAGPYVDFICTHEYTFTLAAPVRSAGRFIGVAAADILATQVERLVLPGLCRLGAPAGDHAVVLASGHGRVIASTSASLPPGAALPRPPQASGFATLAGPGEGPPPGLLPWSLLTVPAA